MNPESEVTVEGLVRRFRAGDAEALCALFDQYEGLLRRRVESLLPRYLRRRVSVADVLQEARVVAHERHLDFEERGTDAFRNWILGIAENKARRAVQWHVQVGKRAAGREVTRPRRLDTAKFAAGGPTPSQVAMGAELERLTREALVTLPPDHREVLRLAQEEQLPLRDVADRMGRSYEATKKMYGRALTRLGEALERNGGISRG